jgi:pimeloyl-ACP methyl ester carboxylesterase
LWSQSDKAAALASVRKLAGIRPVAKIPEAKREKAGKVTREDYHIDKLVLHGDSGVPMPALTYHPKDPQEEAYVYLHDGGKAADGAVGGPIEKLVDEGYVVVAVDLRGQGETASGKPDSLLGDWKSFYLAYLLGKPLVGMHAEDVLVTGRFVANYETKKPRKVHLVAVGNSGIAALHAAALEPDLFATVTLRGTPESWSSVVSQKAPAGLLTTTVHGALTAYDLPDLVKAIGPDKIRLESKP